MKVYINADAFRFIENTKSAGVTAEGLSARFRMSKRSAATWLSKWKAAGYLIHRRGAHSAAGVYFIDNSCLWWGLKVFDTSRDDLGKEEENFSMQKERKLAESLGVYRRLR